MEKARPIPLSGDGGFMAAQSLIGAAIVASIAVVLTGILGNLSDLSGRYIVKEQQTSATLAVQSLLLQEDTCSRALTSSGPVIYDGTQAVNIAEIKSPAPNPANDVRLMGSMETYQAMGSTTRISIGQLRLEPIIANTPGVVEKVYNAAPAGTINTPVEYETHLARLVIPSSMGAPYRNNDASTLPNEYIGLKLYVDRTTKQIARCFSIGNENQICRSFNGIVDPTTGRCTLPPCTATEPVWAAHFDCPGPGERDPRSVCDQISGAPGPLTDRLWIWVFTGGTTSAPSQMSCICVQSCS